MTLVKKKRKKYILGLGGILLVLILGCAVYLGDFYHADMKAIEKFSLANPVEMIQCENGNYVFEPEEIKGGYIFYPGGKVEHTAYVPLMKALASEGILCVLVEMPFHLAVFDMDAADGILQQYPQIENWYIGGHSLGGAMAASYVSECAELFDGVVLLGAYSTADLSKTDLKVLSIYGSEDMVMNHEKYEAEKINLPEGFTEMVIDGGCHGYFGMYGMQDGDGIPRITNEMQILLTAEAIAAFF